MIRYTVIGVIEGSQPYEGTFDSLEVAEAKRDLLVEKGAGRWLILEDDGVNTREIASSESPDA